MKLQDLLGPIFFALIVSWGLQIYFGNKDQMANNEAKSGQRFTAPKQPEIQIRNPINTEINFIDTKPTRKSKSIQIDTHLARYEFSNNGAALSRVEFHRNWAGKQGLLGTIFPAPFAEKERSAFLVAFNEETPYYFDFIDQKEEADKYFVSYKADFNGGILYKTFTVFKNSYQLDLKISIQLKDGIDKEGINKKIIPRIFFPSPLVPELAKEDTIMGIANDEKNNIKIFPKNEQLVDSYWVNPTFFGTQDRYFAQAMVKDPNNFVQRGYYKMVDIDSLYSILEGPSITQDNSWDLTFYVGPKEDTAMALVDERLEQTLNYGWFSFISKPLSKWMLEALNFINKYVNNYGVAIILLTIFIKLILFPFMYSSENNMKKSGEVQKKFEHLQKQYKNDPEGLVQARIEFFRKHGTGLGNFLPMFFQLPFFWALSITLSNSIQLYKASFLWIPDLSIHDPYYILPVLFALSIIFYSPQSVTYTSNPGQRIQSIIIGVIVGAAVSSLAAGLMLYIMINTFLGILQSFIVRRLKLV